ncbi:L,D-transpeptidase [Bdellovibrio svalbardensis]|uniref:L,D-transpeptidase n=1 Tax=Bdellovibrio svalbardensis TaxID=2972972 RepID=A0ABT6DEA4_9BACT|nr:L,D-transpeptidase [Bdellovibrio svalbardensis]MDG0815170.1 L,D-transpeptidase [Bdellovibrio svalbardensis]
MKTKHQLASLVVALLFSMTIPVNSQASNEPDPETTNVIEELNPFDPNIEQTLQQIDEIYERETGKSAHLENSIMDDIIGIFGGCSRNSCAVWAQVVKSSQRMYLYVNGSLRGSWAVSTGMAGYGTPNFDRHPDGRIYDAYTSGKYPGGDYNGLGNMPYAVFITGGYALHGTPRGNWPKLGTPASHGCIRMHPDNAYMFNRLVRANGKSNVWITVQ